MAYAMNSGAHRLITRNARAHKISPLAVAWRKVGRDLITAVAESGRAIGAYFPRYLRLLALTAFFAAIGFALVAGMAHSYNLRLLSDSKWDVRWYVSDVAITMVGATLLTPFVFALIGVRRTKEPARPPT